MANYTEVSKGFVMHIVKLCFCDAKRLAESAKDRLEVGGVPLQHFIYIICGHSHS